MKRVIVEFGAYGDIADFEIEDDVTEDTISSEAWAALEEFISMEWSYRIENENEQMSS